jgi:hypothetical protein
VLDQSLGEPLEAGEAHEGDERSRCARERGGVETLDVVRCERGHGRREAAVRDRDADRAGNGCERRDAGDDLERDAGIGERERLLAAAPEQKRVTALEAYDTGPLAAERDEHRVHLVLCEAVALDSQCVRRCLVDELGRDEPVIDEHVACTQALEPLDRDQSRVARAGADERNGHESAFATAFWKKSRRSS